MVSTNGENKLILSDWFCLFALWRQNKKDAKGRGQGGSGGLGHCGLGDPPSGEVFLCSCGSWGLNPRGLISVYLAHTGILVS